MCVVGARVRAGTSGAGTWHGLVFLVVAEAGHALSGEVGGGRKLHPHQCVCLFSPHMHGRGG